jgi:hypothetical protein
MNKFINDSVLLRAVALAALGLCSVGVALGDDTPPPTDSPAPGGRHRNDPAWAACRKQADDQKLERGDARREFMKTCLKSAKSSAAPPAN